MHPMLFRESFFFHSRDDLEHLQPLSQSLLNMIVAGSNVLPLRPIHRVDMGSYGSEDEIRVFIEPPSALLSLTTRLQFPTNTCVKEFNVGIHDSHFMRYWKVQEAATCTVVSIDFRLTDDTDYDFVDSIMHHVRPKTSSAVHVEESFDENGYNDEHMKLLARDSFLLNLQTWRLCVWDNTFPPPSFILKAPGYRNYELECGLPTVVFMDQWAADNLSRGLRRDITCIGLAGAPSAAWEKLRNYFFTYAVQRIVIFYGAVALFEGYDEADVVLFYNKAAQLLSENFGRARVYFVCPPYMLTMHSGWDYVVMQTIYGLIPAGQAAMELLQL